jgi:hypothetical protein
MRFTMSNHTLPRGLRAESGIEPGRHHQRLERLRDQEGQRRFAIVVFSALGLMVLLAGSLGIVDFHFEAAGSARLIAWAAIAVAVIALVVMLRRWRAFRTVDAVCQAERARPDIGQRLRTSHDYQTNPEQVSPANPELIRALEVETQERVASHPIEPLGRSWPIYGLLGGCAAMAIAWLVAFVALPEWRVATARLLFVPVHYSDVRVEPLPDHVSLGQDMVVRLQVTGRPLQTARVLYRNSGDAEWSEAALQPDASGPLVNELTARVPDCRQDIEVQIQAGHYDSGIHPVAVRLPLVLEEWKAKLQPPAYTGLPAADGSPQGMRVPEGSNLQLAAKYNRRPSEVEVEVESNPVAAKPALTEIDDAVAHLAIITDREPMDLSVHAVAADGMEDESSLHIEVVPDRRPELRFVAPEATAEAIPTAELHFSLQAFDDYGLGTVGIRYRVDDGPEQTLWERAENEPTSAIAMTVSLPLEDLDVSYPQALTYYAYAIDNRQPETQRATSELRFIDIRPYSREYEFKEGQCSGSCQGECLTLEKLIKQQREILGKTFAATQQVVPADPIGAKLAAQEQDLRTKTISLNQALQQKVGPMPRLDDATEAMSEAIEHLSAQAIAEGQTDQERALADLVAARQNLRKILKQSDSKAQMCRNVDQQQMDKIRKPERDQKKEQEQQLAQLREQLKQLAQRQENFCQSAKACQQAGASKTSGGAGSADGGADSQPPSMREQLAQQQQQSAAETREIQRRLSEGEFGELAPKRARQAAESIAKSGESVTKPGEDSQAIAQAESAAEQLTRLSEHLGRRHHPDFGDKLAVAGRQAEQLSERQRQLSETLAADGDAAEIRQQQQLAAGAEELADLVDQLRAESAEQDWLVQRALTEQASANPPEQAAANMQQAAQSLEQRQGRAASGEGQRAAATLKRFAAGVNEIQQAMGPARLEQLTNAEKRAAELIKSLRRATGPAERAMVQAGASEFAESIRSLTNADDELAAATETILRSQGVSSPNAPTVNTFADSETSTRFGSAPTTLADGLRNVDEILQRRIQEAILSGAIHQPVGAVPPEYSKMVEDYYRKLSEDVE